MESEGSLPCSQETANGPYPESDESRSQHHILFSDFNFNIIHPPRPRSSCCSFSDYPNKTIYIRSSSPHVCYIPCPSLTS
jgi:hypothetical protein